VGMKKRLVISVIFLVPLMIFSMGIMFVHGNFSMHYVALIQFLLLLPILWVNRKYFIVGFKMLFKGVPNMDTLIALGFNSLNGLWGFCFLHAGKSYGCIF
jgi:cation transport ATPase